MAAKKKVSKALFWIGMGIVAITSILLLTINGDLPLSMMGFMGILIIGVSNYRPLAK